MPLVADLASQCQDPGCRAAGLAALVQDRVGQAVPEELIACAAAAEEDVLMALLRIEAARSSKPI